MDYPQYTDLLKLLANPLTFGILISLIWEQTAWFRDDKTSPAWKISAVAITGLVWSIGLSILNAGGLPTTWSGWYNVLMLGVATAASTQVFHKLVNGYLPALAALLVALRIGKPPEVAAVSANIRTVTVPLSGTPFAPAEALPPAEVARANG